MGSALGGVPLKLLTYSYEFDEAGAIAAYAMSLEMFAGMGTDEYGNEVPVDIIMNSSSEFSQVGTLENIQAIPSYLTWTDMSKISCTDRGMNHTPVTLAAIEPTCFGLGRTECSYCANCYETVVEAEMLDPVHDYVGGICTDCGGHSEEE
jgi:hypothetical protein